MSGPFKNVGENELAFFFQTNEPIPARPLLNFLAEVERIALSKRYLGPDVIVEITEIKTGTKSVRLTFNQKMLVAGAAIAAGALAVDVARLGLEIADRLQHSTGRLAESVAEMCSDHGVVESTVSTHNEQIRIPRDEMPALAALDMKRSAPVARDFPTRPSALQVDEAISSSEIEAVHSPDFIAQRGEILAGLGRPRDKRIYTIVGILGEPGAPGNVVPRSTGQFRTQSGKTYIARGVDWDHAPHGDDPVVIRAQIDGRDGEFTALNVMDVFKSEEP